MVRTPSTMPELGLPAPDFSLPDTVSGNTVTRSDYAGKPLLVAFICNHCPYVKHIQAKFAEFAREYQDKGLAVVAISSNDVVTHPDDHPDKMTEEARTAGYTFPYLFDETQEVAKAYQAACTPDFFLYDRDHKLFYRGRFDASTPRNDEPLTGADMRAAANAVLAGEPPPAEQLASLGCNIKWREGNEPS